MIVLFKVDLSWSEEGGGEVVCILPKNSLKPFPWPNSHCKGESYRSSSYRYTFFLHFLCLRPAWNVFKISIVYLQAFNRHKQFFKNNCIYLSSMDQKELKKQAPCMKIITTMRNVYGKNLYFCVCIKNVILFTQPSTKKIRIS